MTWTTDADECENACGVVMAEGRYCAGSLGHYCSRKCRDASESGGEPTFREDFHSDI